jgi:hypothetical protein
MREKEESRMVAACGGEHDVVAECLNLRRWKSFQSLEPLCSMIERLKQPEQRRKCSVEYSLDFHAPPKVFGCYEA